MKKLRLILYFPPALWHEGRLPISVHFTERRHFDRESGLLALTRGEGTALQFVLEDHDASTAFHQALLDGRFLAMAQDRAQGGFELRYVPARQTAPSEATHLVLFEVEEWYVLYVDEREVYQGDSFDLYRLTKYTPIATFEIIKAYDTPLETYAIEHGGWPSTYAEARRLSGK